MLAVARQPDTDLLPGGNRHRLSERDFARAHQNLIRAGERPQDVDELRSALLLADHDVAGAWLQTVNHGESPEACPRTSNLSSRFTIILESRSQRYWAFL
jgi:hypothetical protein